METNAASIGRADRRRRSFCLPHDARLLQIGTLATFATLQIIAFDFATSLPQVLATCSSCLLAQTIFSKLSGVLFDWRSPLITGLSLSLLLRTHEPFLWCSAGGLAIGSKFLLRVGGKHVFNPACFGIVALLLASGQVWVSPAVWGAPAWFAFLVASLGTLVLSRSVRLDTALAFFAVYGGLLLTRCLVLDDPWAIPFHQLQSGALVLFGTFMITDPRSTPNDRLGRVLFATFVAVVAYELQFGWQIREGLFYALALTSPLTPLIDLWRPGTRFRWTNARMV